MDESKIEKPKKEEGMKEKETGKEVSEIAIDNHEQYEKLKEEFNRQIENLIKKGFPKLAGMDEEKFAVTLEPLREKLKELASKKIQEGHIPFVVVAGEELVPLEKKIPLMEVDGVKGDSIPGSSRLKELKTAKGIKIPKASAYLIADIGFYTDNTVPPCYPKHIAEKLKKEGCSLLTAEEGVALILQYPEILKDHRIGLAGSYFEKGGESEKRDEFPVLVRLGSTPCFTSEGSFEWPEWFTRDWPFCDSRVGP